jgi:hypothetical protein
MVSGALGARACVPSGFILSSFTIFCAFATVIAEMLGEPMTLLNCDMGEGYGIWRLGDDGRIMPAIHIANVA